jgi:UDP-N-acetylglucosamine--N-acetylmuramyl-(pentapeptide) pyrophosphoryl-undecaprenol N-acetylglucosamine transferase
MTDSKPNHYFFAGGGTGGHIYPAIAVAQRIRKIEPDAAITFLCSSRPIDEKILSKSGFEFVKLPSSGFSLRPVRLVKFIGGFIKGYAAAGRILKAAKASCGDIVIVGTGGFVSPPALIAANKLKIPIAMINVDSVPGRANKLLASLAKVVFVQFETTKKHFKNAGGAVEVVGCPLRESFFAADKTEAMVRLGLDENKKTLVITGASSGSVNINRAVCKSLEKLARFAGKWQIVHITGAANLDNVKAEYEKAAIDGIVLDYCDDMAALLSIADIVIGRAGAVSIAEFAQAGTATICIPYPYHKDNHQYLNAKQLADAGGAIIVEDNTETAKNLSEELLTLMADDTKRNQMATAAKTMSNPTAAEQITEKIISVPN